MASQFYTNALRYKNKILMRGYDEYGERMHKEILYSPTLYTVSDGIDTGWRAFIGGKNLIPKEFHTMSDARQFIDDMAIRPDVNICGSSDYVSCFLNDCFEPDMSPDMSKVRVLTMDIEVGTEGGYAPASKPWQPVTAITIGTGKKFFSFGLKDFAPPESNMHYLKCTSESDLLNKFLTAWNVLDADIVTGWNTNGYDLPYLKGRIDKVLGDGESSRLSPWNLPVELRDVIGRFGMKTLKPSIPGIACIDLLDLYLNMKFVQAQRESYTLDYISQFELGDRKTPYQELGYPTLQSLYEKNPQLYMEYNVQDVSLVERLEKKLGFIQLLMAIAYDARINYADATGSVKLWECLIRNKLLKKKQIPPLRNKNDHGNKEHSIMGAYVKATKPGIYKWCVSFDASSLYPSIIRQWNISPETFKGVKYKVNMAELNDASWTSALQQATLDDCTIASNGAAFNRRTVGILPELMAEYFDKKQKYGNDCIVLEKKLESMTDKTSPEAVLIQSKIRSLKLNRKVTKITLNSAYGSMSNPYFLFYNDDVAESVTMSGQTFIRFMADNTNIYLNRVLGTTDGDYIVASDTDSIIVDCSRLIQDMVTRGIVKSTDRDRITEILDQFAKGKMQPLLHEWTHDLEHKTNASMHAIDMAREVIADKALWVASKNYVMRVIDLSGVRYAEPHYKIMGLEIVRSSTPTACRTALKDAMKLVLDDDSDKLINFIENFRNVHMSTDIDKLAKTTKVSRLEYYALNTQRVPQQVRASLLYNEIIKDKGLTDMYSSITEGSKVKLVRLKMPNPCGSSVMAFPDGILPDELGLKPYIDYDTMFEDTFLKPLRRMTVPANVETEHRATLASLWE